MATPRPLADSSGSSFLLSLIAHADDPMVIAHVPATAGEDARVVSANPPFCRLAGRSLDELIDREWLTLCNADSTLLDRINRALYRREHLSVDLPLTRSDGLEIITHCELLPIRDTRGVATAMLIVQRDITEPLHTRETLDTLRAMTRRTSHEVNNELASVIINLTLASGARIGDQARREHIGDALKAAREAAETAKRLSTLATDVDLALSGAPAYPEAPASLPALSPPELTPQGDPLRAEVQPVSREPEPEPDEPPPAPRIGSLLILDDDPIVKGLLANYLGGSGFDVDATTESERCVELYREAFHAGRRFDLVILDLRIGRDGMGGIEALKELLAIDPQVRAIAHSGYSTDDVMLNPTQYGFVAAIKKPTPPSEIARVLSDVIRVHG